MAETPTTQINFPPAQSNDHDLLISMKAEVMTKLDRVISDVKDLKDDLATRVSELENEKVSKEEYDTFKLDMQKTTDDHEERIRWNTKWIQYGLGISIFINFLIGALVAYKAFHP